MKNSSRFSAESMMKVFKIVCTNKYATAKDIAQRLKISHACSSRILTKLAEKGFLTRRVSKKIGGRGRNSYVYNIGDMVSVLIYDIRDGEAVIYRYHPKTNTFNKVLFKYKNKRSSESKASFFVRTQKGMIKRANEKKLVIGEIYLVDGYLDPEKDRLVSKISDYLSEIPFSHLGYDAKRALVRDYGNFISEYLESIIKTERLLFVDFSSDKRTAYLFEEGRSLFSANIGDLQRLPQLAAFSINNMSHREENISSVLNLLYCLFKPCDICAAVPFIDDESMLRIRANFLGNELGNDKNGNDILFIDSAEFDLVGAAVSLVMKHLSPEVFERNPKK